MKTFCTCTDYACKCHPNNTNGSCNPCIIKNLERHEIPACFWHKIGQSGGAQSDYSFYKFAEALSSASTDNGPPDNL